MGHPFGPALVFYFNAYRKVVLTMKYFIFIVLVWSTLCPVAVGQDPRDDDLITVSGLIIPRDDQGMYVRNLEGEFEIEWSPKTEVALEVNTRQFRNIKNGVLHYQVQASKQVIEFPLPEGLVTAVKTVRRGKPLETVLKEANDENWISEFGLILRFGESPQVQQLPTDADPQFVGLWNVSSSPRTISINGKSYELSLKKGGQTNALLFGIVGTDACAPFVNRARVIGRKKGDVILVETIHLLPIGDQASKDDPSLPRYLFIGDSISGNYDRGLRDALAEKFNIHHPPTNCGPTGKGKANIVEWLGAYDVTGRGWDVISFNFGHWDAGNTKANYQSNLRAVIDELVKTKARLIWVTTCPVPNGNKPAGKLSTNGKAPGRTAGVMKKFLNPWALEVVTRYPQIEICDQWQFVKDHERDIYSEWWQGDNVHFNGKQASELGNFLAEQVLKGASGKN